MKRQFDYVNTTFVDKVNEHAIGILQPYKCDNISSLPRNVVPSYLKEMKTVITVPHRPPKPTWNDLVKIFQVNQGLRDCMISIKDKFIKPGQDITKIDDYLYNSICKKGLYPSCFGYNGYPKASCISINNVVAHGIPYQYKLKEGDVVSVDVCAYNGFHSDLAETYIVPGKGDKHHKELVDATRFCLTNALHICRPGAAYKSIGRTVSKTAIEHGFNVITRLTGHGIGKELHMFPKVYNYPHHGLEDEGIVMQVGDMFSVEPILTEGNGDIRVLDDGFTIVTTDDACSAHFERVVLITEDGHIVLNDIP